MKEYIYALKIYLLMVTMMSHLRVHGLNNYLNNMMNMHWVIFLELNMTYLRAHHWDSECEAIGSEEGMELGTGEVLSSTLGAAKNDKIGLDDRT